MRWAFLLLGLAAGCATAPDKKRAEAPHVYIRIVRTDRLRAPIDNARPYIINYGDRRDIWGTPFPQNAPEDINPQPNLQPVP